MTSHRFAAIAFSVDSGGNSALRNARVLFSAEENKTAFEFLKRGQDTYFDASGLAVRVQAQTVPDPLGHSDWVDVSGVGGYGSTSDYFRLQRVTWGDGKTSIVLTVELFGYSTGDVAMIRLRGAPLPDPQDAAAVAAFLASAINSPVSGVGFDTSQPF